MECLKKEITLVNGMIMSIVGKPANINGVDPPKDIQDTKISIMRENRSVTQIQVLNTLFEE